MKHLILLLLIATATLSVSAQRSYKNNGRYKDKYERNERRDDHRYDRNTNRQRVKLQREINSINREFDKRIQKVQRKPFTRASVKSRKIHELEYQRRVALNDARAKFSRDRGYATDDDRRERNYRRNKW